MDTKIQDLNKPVPGQIDIFGDEYVENRIQTYETKEQRIKEIRTERIYQEVYGDTIKDLKYQKIKKAEIEQILEAAERIK